MPGQLDQRGIPFAPHDLFVDRARLRGVHGLTLELLVSLPQRELAEYRLAGERVVIDPLPERGA